MSNKQEKKGSAKEYEQEFEKLCRLGKGNLWEHLDNTTTIMA
jgi:hypothetical protein